MEGLGLAIEVVAWTAGEFRIIACVDTCKVDGYSELITEVVGWAVRD